MLLTLASLACGAEPPTPQRETPSPPAGGSPGSTEPGTGIEVQPRPGPQPTVTALPTATPYPTATPFPTAAPVAGAVATQPPTIAVTTPAPGAAATPTATAAAVGPSGAPTGSAQFSFSRKTELTHPKVGTALNQLIARVEAGEISAEEAASQAPIHREDSIGVAIHLSGNVDDVVRFLEANGASNISARDDYIEAYVPVLLLAETSEQPGVVRVRPIQPPEEPQSGSGIPGNGPGVHGSAAWNQAGFTGKGIKVGVIDGGFGGFADIMGTEVPTTVQARCYLGLGEHSDDLEHCGGSTHGTVVAESVIDIAPEVSLYISDPQSPGDLRDAVDWMISQGVSVINHSRTWLFDGPGDGTSPASVSPLNTVDRAVEAGIVWVNATGNSAQRAWFKRGPFSYTTITVDGQDFRVLNFDEANFRNRFHVWGPLQLRWDDTWSGATRDLDLFLASPDGGEITLVSIDPQSGEDGHIPYERVVAFASYDIMIAHHSGSEPGWIQLLAWQGEGLAFNTPDAGSTINPAESTSSGMLAVGAAHWNNVTSIQSYSSRGPTPDGRTKPDVVAADCGETASASRPFCGTSQAAPHVAGMAALVRHRFPGYTPAQVVAYLKENADQRVNSPDPNDTWGHGFVVLPSISPQLSGSPTITSLTGGARSLTATWSAPSSDGGSAITAYDLRHIRSDASSKADSNWTVVEDVWTGSGALTHVLTGLAVGARYDVEARAVTAAGDGPWSATMSGATASTAPGAPTGLTAAASGQTQIDLSWSAPSNTGGSPITGYRIEVAEDGSSWSDLVGNTRSAATTYSHTGLIGGSTRHYRVSAINSVGTGTVSNVSFATTAAALAPELVVGTPTVSESAPTAGARFTLSATVRNQGSGRSDSTTLRYYRSTDPAITTGDTEVGTDFVSRLDASASGDESISLTAPSTPGTYYYGACVEAVSDETDTTNNCSVAVTVTVGTAPASDLVVETPTVDTSAPTAGARFTLSATVRNQGSGRSDSTTLRYYQSTDSTITTGDTEVGTDSVFGLGASASGDESISLTAPSTAGTYYYGACVDALSDETDTTNNCSVAVTVTVGAAPAPDLVVDTPTVDTSAPTAGARFTLSATVRNQGSGASAFTTLRYYQSTDSTITTGDTEVGTDSVFRLAASASGDESISLTAPATAGTYYYGACVDAVSDETDTTNNCSSAVTVTVGAAPAPDLVVDTPTVDTSAPVAGARFTLSATVRNQGSGRSDSTTLRYYQSTDPAITTADTEVGTDFVSRLDASASGDESINVTAPAAAGTYYYGACVEAVPDELDTTNNCSVAVTVTVGAAPAPDLVVETPTVDTSAPVAGARFTLSATVRNQGSGASAFTTLRYYQSTDSTITTGDTEVGTDSVFRLAASASGDESISVTVPSTAGTYYYGACVEAVSDETDTTNNCSSAVTVTVGAAPAPDLVVDTPTVDTSAPVAGARFTLRATVRNQGSGASGSTTLRYYRSTDSTITTGDTEVGTDSVFRLAASASGDESISLTAPSTAGTYYYGACVEAVSDESDTTNNCSVAVTMTVGAAPAPDLLVDTPTVDTSAPTAGASFTLNATVRNQGSARSGSTTLRYYRSADSTITTGDTAVGTDSVSGLAAAGSGDESISLTAPSTPGTYYYGACVDAVSDETDTTNNCSAGVTVTVGAAPAPDLVVGAPTVDASAPVAGARFTLSATVRNQGSGASDSTTLRYYQSTDSTITTGDTEIGTDTVFRLAASAEGSESISLTAPSTAGTFYYGACVDAVSEETDTTNNCSVAVTVTVGAAPAPDLVVDTPTVDTSAPVAGARFTLRATVRNQGSGASGSTTLRYYRSTDSTITTGDTAVGTDLVSGLAASARGGESISLTAPSTAGTYYYGACVEAVSDELDTTNNCSVAVTMTVGAAPAPDLLVDTPTVDTSAPTAGASFTLNATVRNQGSARSGSTTLRYYRSADSTITTGDTAVGTDSVSGLAAAGSGDESTSLTAPSTPGTYYYGACVDAVSDETDTTNNCSAAVTVTVGAAPAPDLVVGMPTVSASSTITGATVTLRATVRNQGSGRSGSTTLRYYRSTDATITSSDTRLPGNFHVNGLSPSGSSALWTNLTAPSTAGTYYYGACVDSVTGESDTANNCSVAVTVTVGAPDLVVDSPAVSDSAPLVGARFTLSATVRNKGNVPSGPTVLRYYRSADATITAGDTQVGSYVGGVNRLSPAGGSDHSIGLTAPTEPGTYYYGACVDSVAGESDTTNNCSAAVTVAAAGRPDLMIDMPTVSNSSPAAGTSYSLSATVRNRGSGSSMATTLRYYRSTDSTISTSDRQVGFDQVSGLGASSTSTQSISLTALADPGTYYYGACVDSVAGESDITNNCSTAVTITVVEASGPDLVADTPTTTDSQPTVGTSFRIVVSVRNRGNATSSSATLRFYRSTDSSITTGDERIDSRSVEGLSPSETTYLYSDPRAPSTPGTYYYGACVVSVIGESDTGNNCSSALTITAGQPDLVVDTPTVSDSSVAAGESFTLDTAVRNQGSSASGFTTLRYYRSADSTITSADTEVDYDPVGPLSPSGNSTERGASLAPSTPGTYYYGACVDSVTGESDTTNNCSAAVAVTVGAGTAPDLVVGTPTVSDSTPSAGTSFTLNATVRNSGGGPSSFTTLRYYRSTDSTITSSDTSVGTDSVSALNASGSSAESISLTAPADAGTYYYGACVDSVTGESSTTNNCSAAVTVTVSQPDLTLNISECFVFQNQHFARFEVTARVSVSSLVVKTYAVDSRDNSKQIIATTNVGDLSAGDSYEKLTSRAFPSNMVRWLTTCAVGATWE